MDWDDIKALIGKAAPLLGTAIGGPAGGAAGALIASALGVDATPDRVADAIRRDPQAAARLRQVELEHKAELRRMVLEAETSQLGEINRTMRAEAAANDPWVRRWRPTFGYVLSLTWAAQIAGVVYAMVAHPANAAEIIQAVVALTPLWGIALTILGVSVSKRSQDKMVAAGQSPMGLLQAFAERIKPRDQASQEAPEKPANAAAATQ